jgi:nucleoside-diphosphate-sugar epimerase
MTEWHDRKLNLIDLNRPLIKKATSSFPYTNPKSHNFLRLPRKMGGECNNHAIVFGASGLIGWALVDQLLSPYPHAGSFSKVTAVTNRPLNLYESHWREPDSHRPDLQLVSGVDLRRGDAAALAECLEREVKDIESVTHIYYLGTSVSPLQYS